MTIRSIMLVGGPDSGKTNYLARLWKALREGNGDMVASTPGDIKYVEDALAHLLQGSFAPHSNLNIDEDRHDFVIPVVHAGSSESAEIVVPDVSGELWKKAVETSELPTEWMEQLNQSVGALIFVRVLSNQNVASLDWVCANRLLKITPGESKESEEISTQVLLCELLRFLEHTLKPPVGAALPRVAVLVTAWDMLDGERAKNGPSAFLQTEYPLFSGRLKDTRELDIRVFGVSIVGGDLENDADFRDTFLDGELSNTGYIVAEIGGNIVNENDLTLPLSWLIVD